MRVCVREGGLGGGEKLDARKVHVPAMSLQHANNACLWRVLVCCHMPVLCPYRLPVLTSVAARVSKLLASWSRSSLCTADDGRGWAQGYERRSGATSLPVGHPPVPGYFKGSPIAAVFFNATVWTGESEVLGPALNPAHHGTPRLQEVPACEPQLGRL